MIIKAKLFLIPGLCFGSLTGIYCSSQYSIGTGLACGTISGIILSILLFIILGPLHVYMVKKVAPELTEEAYGTCHVRNITINRPFEQAFSLCIESLSSVKNSKITARKPSQGKIIAKTPINWKTWGDTIIFELKQTDDATTELILSSRPTARTTIVDYGKNIDNIQKIVYFLENI